MSFSAPGGYLARIRAIKSSGTLETTAIAAK
jgi:hypothetical protein